MNYTVNGVTQSQTAGCREMNVDDSHITKLKKNHPEIIIEDYIAGVLNGDIAIRKYSKRSKKKVTVDDSTRSKYYTVGGIRKSEADWSRDIGKYSDYLGALRRRHPEADIEGVIAKELLNIMARKSNNEIIETPYKELEVAANKKSAIKTCVSNVDNAEIANRVLELGIDRAADRLSDKLLIKLEKFFAKK